MRTRRLMHLRVATRGRCFGACPLLSDRKRGRAPVMKKTLRAPIISTSTPDAYETINAPASSDPRQMLWSLPASFRSEEGEGTGDEEDVTRANHLHEYARCVRDD